MKNVSLLILLLVCLKVSAQGVFANQTNSAIEKVIQDYPNQFKNITGALLTEKRETADYQSNIQIPGAISCQVIKYNSSKKELCWRAELVQSISFEEARGVYKEMYNQIRNSIVKIEGEKPYILNGQYDIPDERKRVHSVVFSMLPSVGEMQRVKVELSLVQQGAAVWKVVIVVHDQDRREHEQGLADN
jgi:hypothetical protein